MQDQTPAPQAVDAFPAALSAPTPFRRRTLLRAALGGAAALGTGSLLAACSSDDSSSSPGGSGSGNAGGSPATVRMWSWYGEQKDEFPKLVAKFQEANPNIKVENRVFGTPDQYLPALQAAVAAGDVPEIFAPHTRALTYGTGGISADLKADLGDDVPGRLLRLGQPGVHPGRQAVRDRLDGADLRAVLQPGPAGQGWRRPRVARDLGRPDRGGAEDQGDRQVRRSSFSATRAPAPWTSSCRCSRRSPTTRPSSSSSTRAWTA